MKHYAVVAWFDQDEALRGIFDSRRQAEAFLATLPEDDDWGREIQVWDGAEQIEQPEEPEPYRGIFADARWEIIEQTDKSVTFALMAGGKEIARDVRFSRPGWRWSTDKKVASITEDGITHLFA